MKFWRALRDLFTPPEFAICEACIGLNAVALAAFARRLDRVRDGRHLMNGADL